MKSSSERLPWSENTRWPRHSEQSGHLYGLDQMSSLAARLTPGPYDRSGTRTLRSSGALRERLHESWRHAGERDHFAFSLWPVGANDADHFRIGATRLDLLQRGLLGWTQGRRLERRLGRHGRGHRSAPGQRFRHGVLAPNAKLRAAVTYIGRPEAETLAAQIPSPTSPSPTQQPSTDAEPTRTTSPARIRWAVLLARIYEVLPLLCPACGGPMRILSFITDPPVVVAILEHLELPHTPPPISPARGPPQGGFLLDQTPVFDPTEAEPIPEFVFDQSLPDEFDS